VILSKFWSRYDLQNFRKRNFLGDDQGELSKGTVLKLSSTILIRISDSRDRDTAALHDDCPACAL
jgi:hypothetical protein